MKKILSFIKKETVLTVAVLLAAASCFIVPPDLTYLSYIDLSTLCMLFCLMAVMAGFQKAGLFSFCADRLLKKVSSARAVCTLLVLICFFFSALITNDVALITFVPFSIALLKSAGHPELIPKTVVLQTVAANMGSSLTPVGNPQNIYLFGISGISFAELFLAMLPYASVTLAVLMTVTLTTKNFRLLPEKSDIERPSGLPVLIYALLFALSLCGVFGILHFGICFGVTAVVLLFYDRNIFKRVDYSLLVTFLGFFIFVGNMGRVPFFSHLISEFISGREVVFAAMASQLISNVPAALLLSGFSNRFTDLLVGVNIGGMGTLIASMASLISYKLVAAELPEKKGKYFVCFSVFNLALLGFMLGISVIL